MMYSISEFPGVFILLKQNPMSRLPYLLFGICVNVLHGKIPVSIIFAFVHDSLDVFCIFDMLFD